MAQDKRYMTTLEPVRLKYLWWDV